MTNQSLRALAEAEAERVIERPVPGDELDAAMWTDQVYNFIEGFIAGRTSVTREQLAEVMFNAYADETGKPWAEEGHGVRSLYLEQADAVIALLRGEVAGDE